MNKSKGSVNGSKHPYLRVDFWLNPSNQFWNKRNHDPNMMYNKEPYEKALAEMVKHQRNFAMFDKIKSTIRS